MYLCVRDYDLTILLNNIYIIHGFDLAYVKCLRVYCNNEKISTVDEKIPIKLNLLNKYLNCVYANACVLGEIYFFLIIQANSNKIFMNYIF